MLEDGEKVHVVVRRTLENDLRRHFVGEVVACVGNIVRVECYSFVFDSTIGFVRLPRLRERIVSLSDATNAITILPRRADLDAIIYKLSKDKRLVLTDGTFELEISEFGLNR